MILELLWWAGWAWCAAWVAAPLLLVPVLGPFAGLVAWALLAPWSALIGMAGLHRLMPASEPGKFRSLADRGSIHWALKSWAPSVYLTVFQPLFFQSRYFQRIALRAFGARLGPGAWVTSRTIVREPHHVRVGARSLIGEYAHLVCSLQPRPGTLVVGGIDVGDDVLVGAYSHLAPGARIGSRSTLEHGVALGVHTTIGEDTRIGAGTTIYSAARIGTGVIIGKGCIIASGSAVPDGARIPDGTVLGSGQAAPHPRMAP